MTEQARKPIERVVIFLRAPNDNNATHILAVQRPANSKNEADKLSLIGGSQHPPELTDPKERMAWYIQDELGDALPFSPDSLVELGEFTNIPGWVTTAYLLEVHALTNYFDNSSPEQITKFGRRPIEFFKIQFDEVKDGIIFSADGLTNQPLRPIEIKSENGEVVKTMDVSTNFTGEAFAFDQFEIVIEAIVRILASSHQD